VRDIGIAVIREVGCRHRRLQHPVRRQPARRPAHRHRDEPAGVPLQSRWRRRQPASRSPRSPRRWPSATPSTRSPTTSPGDAGELRADPRLRRCQGAPVRLREVPGRGRHAHDDDEVGRRGDGHRSQLHRGLQKACVPSSARIPPSTGVGTARVRPPLVSCSPSPSAPPMADSSPSSRPCVVGSRSRGPRGTGIDPWFLDQIELLNDLADSLERADRLGPDLLRLAKRHGFSDQQIGELRGIPEAVVRGVRHALGVRPVFKTVDTCAAEFAARTPYHYSSYDEETEVAPRERPAVLILGSGPNRIGQGVEFDYSCVHASFALRTRATTRSWSTATRRRCRPTTTRAAVSTSSRSPSRTCSRSYAAPSWLPVPSPASSSNSAARRRSVWPGPQGRGRADRRHQP
jgi:hypothetical protein